MVGQSGPIVIAVLTRAPSRGGKSRLFAALGRAPDPALLSALLLDTLDGVRSNGTTRIVFVDPADACDDVRALVPADVGVRPQRGGSLGDRMRLTMDGLFAEGASIVALVGSDLPDITSSSIASALSILKDDPSSLALGPAQDGGYYLIAATTTPNVFDGIEWSGPRVLEQTRAAATMNGVRVHLVEPLRDVDTPEDLYDVRASRTRAWADRTRGGQAQPDQAN
jgi:rSAM/selenodomain-associated transferase 1